MRLRINWDALGITASVACAIHCAVLPLFFQALPFLGINIIHNHLFELVMVILAFGIGAWSFYHGYRRHHHNYLPATLFVAGMALLVARLVYAHHLIWPVIPAALLIVAAHFANFRLCRVHNHAHHDDCEH